MTSPRPTSPQSTSDVAFTPAVKAVQTRLGSRAGYASMEARGGWPSAITDELAAFLALRDSVYVGTATAGGQPYVQHRGGEPGFLVMLDEKRLAFADYSGNRQYISVGNLTENDRAFLFAMDYRNRQRVKLWGRMEAIEDDPDLLARVHDERRGPAERVMVFHVEAWNANCPKHIPVMYPEHEVSELRRRVAELEAEIDRLRDAAG